MILSNLKNARFLIIDDQPANIAVLEDLLETQGYTNIMSTTDPRDSLHLFASFEPDIILLDLMMPFLDGFEVMAQLKPLIGEHNFIPILVLTADATSDTKKRALSEGASDFLTKPFDLIEVGLRIKNLLLTSYLLAQLKDQNVLLEEKVMERTKELLDTNRRLEIAKNKAETSSKLKTAFMQNISHEVRTPLNGILGFSSLMIDPDLSMEDKEEFMEMLQDSSDRLVKTITDYMDVSLIASESMEVVHKSFDVVDLLRRIKNKYDKKAIKHAIEFNLITPLEINDFQIISDEELLSKSLLQLIDNAFKFTQNGSIGFGYQLEADKIKFFVRDTGAGIHKNAQELVFESFMQEDVSNTRGHEGSGLGLTIAKGIVELLGGTIELDSEKNKGSLFQIILPLNAPLKTKNNDSMPKIDTKNVAALIAEDDSGNMFFISHLLRTRFKKLFLASDGLEAIQLLQENPEIQLVLMDLKMPKLDGYKATTEIKKLNKDIKVLAITAFGMSGDEQLALDAGCDDYLSKPFKNEHLFEKIASLGFNIK